MTLRPFNKLLCPRWGQIVFSLAACLLMVVASFAKAAAQVDDLAPPPSRVITKENRQNLDAKSSPKDRTKLSLELMEIHLASAEKSKAEKNFRRAYAELGAFHGLLGDLSGFLDRANKGGGKVLGEFKRMEITLRRFGPRIEGIRRELPYEFDEYVKDLLQDVRDVRSRAVEHFFDNSAVPPGEKKTL